MALFEFTNPSGSSYFIMETVRNNQGFYDSSSLKAASGSLNIVSNIPSTGIVQSDYIWGTVVPPGSSSVAFTASLEIPTGSVYFRGTGEFSVSITSDSTPTFDPDAQLFITNAAITDTTQQTAINSLVVSMKGYGIWTKMKALYPFVGGTAAQHKFNLKNPLDTDAAFRLTFNGGWTHSSNGALPNGTNGYANTFLIENNTITANNEHLAIYSRTNATGLFCDIGGATSTTQSNIYPNYSGGFFTRVQGNSTNHVVNLNTQAMFLANRVISTEVQGWRNTTKYTLSNNSVGRSTSPFLIANSSLNGVVDTNYSPREYAFTSIGDGLTDTDVTNYYTAVQTFQTTLGRHVGVPIVSDSDAQAFLNAAVITDTTQATAVNTLVTDLKGYGVWSKMKALYPMVGGTATTHKFNLKNPLDTDAAFRLVFNGGWTHSSTGALPNGTNAYANSFFNPTTQALSKDSTHLSYYRRNTDSGSRVLMSAMSVGVYLIRLNLSPNYSAAGGNISEIVSQTDQQSGTAISDLGLLIGNRISSAQFKIFANSTLKQTVARTSSTQVNASIHIACANYGGSLSQYTIDEVSLASIGDGLTDTEAANYYTAVQAFQTTLSRNV